MFRDVPSIETPGVSVLDEYHYQQSNDPNHCSVEFVQVRRKDAHTDKKYKLDKESSLCAWLFMTPRRTFEDKKIKDVLPILLNTNLALLADYVCVPKVVLCS